MQTRWMDNDHYGHVNNVAYYSYFDSAVNGYLMEATSSDTRELSAIGIVAETSCRFLSEVSFPDLLHIGLRLEKLGNSSVIYELAVFRGAERTLASSRPALLFECEGRHLGGRSPHEVFAHLKSRGYRGQFFSPRGLRPIEEFDPAVHQRRASGRFWEAPGYCNNFFFRPD